MPKELKESIDKELKKIMKITYEENTNINKRYCLKKQYYLKLLFEYII